MNTVAAAVAHRGPWNRNPVYLAATNHQVVPGGRVTYVVARSSHYTPRDKTIFIAGQAHWSENRLPDILSIINPPIRWDEYRHIHQPETERNAGGVVQKERWPVPRSQARTLRHFDVLPDQIFSGEPGWVIESWMRLDPTIQYEDILMRMYRPQRPPTFNALNMRRLRARDDFDLILWERRSISVNTRTQRILAQLPAYQIAANSTAAPAPGAANAMRAPAPAAATQMAAAAPTVAVRVSVRRPAREIADATVAPASDLTSQVNARRRAPVDNNSTAVPTPTVTTQANTRRRAPKAAIQVSTQAPSPIALAPLVYQDPTRPIEGPFALGLPLPPLPSDMRTVLQPDGMYYVPVTPSPEAATPRLLRQNTPAPAALQPATFQRDDVARTNLDRVAPASAIPHPVGPTPPTSHRDAGLSTIPRITVTAPDNPSPVASPTGAPRRRILVPPPPPREPLSAGAQAIAARFVSTPVAQVLDRLENTPAHQFDDFSRPGLGMGTDMDENRVISPIPRYDQYVHPLARWPITYGWNGPRFHNPNNGV